MQQRSRARPPVSAVAVGALVLASCLVLVCAGCTRGRSLGIEPLTDGSALPETVVRRLYGDRLEDVTRTDDDTPALLVYLASGEPTRTEPFVVFAAMLDTGTWKSPYDVDYTMGETPDDQNGRRYTWDAATGRVLFVQRHIGFSGPSETARGVLTGVTTQTVRAIAAGTQSAPDFTPLPSGK